MTCIVTADIHLNLKPHEEHRWGLFDWLLKQEADELIIAGDFTDAKDHHSAQLVNRFYLAARRLSEKFKVIWLKGNHDWLTDSQTPFFKFLEGIPHTSFVNAPWLIPLSIGKATFVPAGIKWHFKLHEVPYCFTHATFSGAKAENGTTLTGVDPAVLEHYKGKVYSGDIHVPQKIGKNIEYIGAPYHTRFGDSFLPRLIHIDNTGRTTDLHYPAPLKHTFRITLQDHLENESAEPGDHVKIRLYLKRTEYTEVRKYKERIREIASERKWVLFGIEPVPLELSATKTTGTVSPSYKLPIELIREYAKRQQASDEHVKIGKELLNGS